MTADASTEREPLGNVFVGTGEYVVVDTAPSGRTYGPFFNAEVAQFWGCDAFGKGRFTLRRCLPPWRVSAEERK